MDINELARELSGESQEAWEGLLESTREFWIKIAKRARVVLQHKDNHDR